MDLRDIRLTVGRATREVFGDRIRITPRVNGEMTAIDDPAREVVAQIVARVEIDSGLERLADERSANNGLVSVITAYTCSCLSVDLPWRPRTPDLVCLLDRPGQPEFTVRGCYPDTADRLLLKLSS